MGRKPKYGIAMSDVQRQQIRRLYALVKNLPRWEPNEELFDKDRRVHIVMPLRMLDSMS